MPGRDGSGPVGRGPATGWGQGNCRESRAPGFGGGRFGGQGRSFGGGGRGWRNRFWATGAPGWMRETWPQPGFTDAESAHLTEQQQLEQRFADLGAEQNRIKTRLGELETQQDD